MSKHRDVQVLVVGSDVLMREAVSEMMRDAGHVVVAEATDGLEAVEKTYSLLPDFVLMDADLPEVSGLEAAEIIDDMCPTPIVMLAPRDPLEPCDRTNGLTYVVKPPTVRELKEAMASARARFERGPQWKEEKGRDRNR